jgi:hypothetical protein
MAGVDKWNDGSREAGLGCDESLWILKRGLQQKCGGSQRDGLIA